MNWRRPNLGRLRVGSLEVDPVSRRVLLHGEPVSLSKKEFARVACFVALLYGAIQLSRDREAGPLTTGPGNSLYFAYATKPGGISLSDYADAVDSPTVDRLDGARDAGYAVVVGTEGGDSTMLAIGFLLALLGRSRIALLSDEVPEALSGCVHVPMDDDGLWRLLLAREMKKAGLEVDLNRAL